MNTQLETMQIVADFVKEYAMLRRVLAIALLIGLSALFVQAEQGSVNKALSDSEVHADEPGEHDAHGDEHGERSDIFSGNIGTSIITIGIFLVLLFILGKYAWGPILTGLQKREEHIRKSIEDAEKAKADADQALLEYQRKLAAANRDAEAILEKGRKDAVRLAEEFKQSAQEEARQLRQRVQADIEAAREQALQEIYRQSTELATELAGQIIGRTLNAEDHRDLLQESLNKLQNSEN